MTRTIRAAFVFEGDESGEVYETTVTQIGDEWWIVATSLRPLHAGETVPEWLVPLELFGHPPEAGDTLILLKHPVPKALLSPDTSSDARQSLGAVLNPLLVQIRPTGHSH